MDIEADMIDFLSCLDYVETLDGNVKAPDGVRIADYLFFNGKTVTELKTLKSDPSDKLNAKAQELMDEESFPLIYGQFDLHKAVAEMPDGDRVNRKLFLYATRQLEGILRSANRQIESTKNYLKLSDSTTGMLLIANDTVKTIPANEIANRICELMSQQSSKGVFKYEHIDTVCIIQNVYEIKNTSIGKLTPVMIVENDFGGKVKFRSVEKDVSDFVKHWSMYNGFNHREEIVNNIDDFEFELNDIFTPVPETMQEKVEFNYRNERYLLNSSEEELIKYGSEIYSRLIVNFKKGQNKLSESEVMQLMKLCIEFNEEARLRPFDMKKLNIIV